MNFAVNELEISFKSLKNIQSPWPCNSSRKLPSENTPGFVFRDVQHSQPGERYLVEFYCLVTPGTGEKPVWRRLGLSSPAFSSLLCSDGTCLPAECVHSGLFWPFVRSLPKRRPEICRNCLCLHEQACQILEIDRWW